MMKSSSMLIAATLVLTGAASAADEGNTPGDTYVDNMVECISEFIASELDKSGKDAFIAECMQARAAGARQPAGANRKG